MSVIEERSQSGTKSPERSIRSASISSCNSRAYSPPASPDTFVRDPRPKKKFGLVLAKLEKLPSERNVIPSGLQL